MRYRSWQLILSMIAVGMSARLAAGQESPPHHAPLVYRHYFGDLHSHTQYSDGAMGRNAKPNVPADHFRLAKETGHDFYAVTDHALKKYPNFTPESYEDTKRQADLFTDETFVGIAGFEFSENDGPDGRGHMNAYNTTSYLDATGPKVGIEIFYDWLEKNQTTTVVASFNHPKPSSYNSFAYLTPERRDLVTMFEVVNGGKVNYETFLVALKHGWRVAPIATTDTHGLLRISRHFYRTGVLALELTREQLLNAIRERRVYATFDQNLRLTMWGNDRIMGSVLDSEGVDAMKFKIEATDPDEANADDRVTRIELIGKDGAVLASQEFAEHSVTWTPMVAADQPYYFALVYSDDKTDGPTAHSAPVWLEE